MVGYQDLSEFECGVIVGARETGHGIFKACEHRHWTVDDWKHVAWSDESRFQLNLADGRIRVWRPPHESMDLTCQQGTIQAGGGSVMVWGVCSWHDMGPLICLDTTLTCDSYVRILSDLLHPFMSIEPSDELGEFQHFRWPPKTLDMNIIEYIWDALQRVVQERSPPPLTPTDLWTALQDSWSHLPPAQLQTSIESMPRRVAALLRARGGPTRY
ncbi:transposable element Tcb2 transposase [Trichonephila clavipes]|nr:transposable element Tcb2 transposase [Trichonephila clavipes]